MSFIKNDSAQSGVIFVCWLILNAIMWIGVLYFLIPWSAVLIWKGFIILIVAGITVISGLIAFKINS